MSFSFQFNAHEVTPAVGISVIPKGDYDVIFSSAEIKPTKSGNGGFIECQFKVINGEHKDAILFERLNLWNQNEQAVNIARAQLSALCHVTEVFVLTDGVNTMNQQMKNKPFKVHVDVSMNEKKEAIGNEVKRLMNADGSLPGRAPSTPSTAAPAGFGQSQAEPPMPATQSPSGFARAQQPPQQAPAAAWAPPQQQAPANGAGGFGQPMASPANAPWMTK